MPEKHPHLLFTAISIILRSNYFTMSRISCALSFVTFYIVTTNVILVGLTIDEVDCASAAPWDCEK